MFSHMQCSPDGGACKNAAVSIAFYYRLRVMSDNTQNNVSDNTNAIHTL